MARNSARSRLASGVALLVPLAVFAACGLGGSRGPSPREVPNTVGRDCRFANDPDATPDLNGLARVGTRGNVSLWGRQMTAADTVELSVRYADDGKLLWVEAIRTTVPRGRLEPLEDLLFEALNEQGRPDWGVRILVIGGEISHVLPSVICPPMLRSRSGMPPRISDPRAYVEYLRVRGRRFPVLIGIDERGNILSVDLIRRTGSDVMDQYLLDFVWRSSFHPKLHDGIPIPSTFETNVEFPRRP